MSLFKELKRRNVIRVAIAYAVVSWVLIQIGNILFSTLELGPEPGKILLAILLLGFIPAILFAWAFEITPEGIKHEKDVVRDESITNFTAKRLDMITIGLLIAAIGLFGLDRLMQQDDPATNNAATMQTSDLNEMGSPLQGDDGVGVGKDAENIVTDNVKTIDNKSVAVLPFTNMSNNVENEPFTMGLHDDLLTHLSRISALKVISRTSVMEYKDTTKKIRDIAQELGVANILEGGVQRSGNQIRLNVQLIDAKTDEHIWAEIYDEELTTANIFSIQTKISKQIAAALKAQLTEQESESIAKAPTNNLDAYHAYLAGRQRMVSRTSTDIKEALALFKRATDLDPNYALGYVGQADSLMLLRSYSDLTRDDLFAQGEPLIAKALALDPNLAEAHTTKAVYLNMRGNLSAAEASFKRAIKLNPNYATAYHWYGNSLIINSNRRDEALDLLNKAANLDPLAPIIVVTQAGILRRMQRYDEALTYALRAHDLDPNFPGALQLIAQLYTNKGDAVQAIQWYQKAINLDPEGNYRTRMLLSYAYLGIGEEALVEAELAILKDQAPEHFAPIWVESLYAYSQGDMQKAAKVFKTVYGEDSINRANQRWYGDTLVSLGRHQEAIDILQPSFAVHFTDNSASIDPTDIHAAIVLTSALQGVGDTQKADQLIAKIRTSLTTSKDPSINYQRALLLALEGDAAGAAQAYAEQVKSKLAIINFWYLDNLAYFAEVRKEPVYIQAREALMQDLQKQRELLKQIRAKETVK